MARGCSPSATRMTLARPPHRLCCGRSGLTGLTPRTFRPSRGGTLAGRGNGPSSRPRDQMPMPAPWCSGVAAGMPTPWRLSSPYRAGWSSRSARMRRPLAPCRSSLAALSRARRANSASAGTGPSARPPQLVTSHAAAQASGELPGVLGQRPAQAARSRTWVRLRGLPASALAPGGRWVSIPGWRCSRRGRPGRRPAAAAQARALPVPARVSWRRVTRDGGLRPLVSAGTPVTEALWSASHCHESRCPAGESGQPRT